jgi:ribosomal-protein-alanine N-acetyltransferase
MTAMSLFSFGSQSEARRIQGEGLYLRAPLLSDYLAWSRLRAASRSFLEPWEPIWPVDDLTRASFRRRIRRYDIEQQADQAYPLFVFRTADHAFVGGLTFSLVRRGVANTASLGYWIGAEFARQGFMTRALAAACRHAFADLGLRRVEAACLPENTASQRLLEKSGFRFEGVAREYLCIAGQWRDHRLYARLAHDPMP